MCFQYSSAKEVLDELGLYDLPMIAIAKGKMRNSGDETFFYNGKSGSRPRETKSRRV